MKKLHLLIALAAVFAASSAALASEEAQTAEAAAAHVPGFSTWPLIRTVLLATLWLFVAAIIIGPMVKAWIGDLWLRKTTQPFIDDAGHAHAPAAHAASHH